MYGNVYCRIGNVLMFNVSCFLYTFYSVGGLCHNVEILYIHTYYIVEYVLMCAVCTYVLCAVECAEVWMN